MNDQPERPDKWFPSAGTQIVIAVIVTCAWFGPRFIREAREASVRSQVKKNLNQISLALQNYHDTHRPSSAFSSKAEQSQPTDATPGPAQAEPAIEEFPDGADLTRDPAVVEESLSPDSF